MDRKAQQGGEFTLAELIVGICRLGDRFSLRPALIPIRSADVQAKVGADENGHLYTENGQHPDRRFFNV
jgi:hypothetical protein